MPSITSEPERTIRRSIEFGLLAWGFVAALPIRDRMQLEFATLICSLVLSSRLYGVYVSNTCKRTELSDLKI